MGEALGERVLEREAAARVGEAVAVAVLDRDAWLRVAEAEGLGGARDREPEAVTVPLGVTARETEAEADTGDAPALREADAVEDAASALLPVVLGVATAPDHVTVAVAAAGDSEYVYVSVAVPARDAMAEREGDSVGLVVATGVAAPPSVMPVMVVLLVHTSKPNVALYTHTSVSVTFTVTERRE